jgi:hypothetical protein
MAAMRRARALNALSGPHAGVPTAPRHSDRAAAAVRTASPRPVPTAPSPLSDAAPPPCPNPAAVRQSDAVASLVHGERRPSSPLTVHRPWSVELTFPSLLTVAGPPPATVAPPRRKNAVAEPDFLPSPSTRSSGELFSPPHIQRVASLSWVLDRRDTRLGALTTPACTALRCAAPSRAALAEADPASAGRAHCAHGPSRCRERGPCATVQLGQARIRPSDTRFSFSNFRIYSKSCKFKNLCRIHLNSENYETNFVGKVLIGTRS